MIDRREILQNGLLGMAGLAAFNPLSALAAEADPYLAYVHPELRRVAGILLQMSASEKPLGPDTLAGSRAGMSRYTKPRRADVPVERRMVPVGMGQPDVAIQIVNAKPGAARPAILHTHGGGYIMGSTEQSVPELQDLCSELDCVAVSVDYRLAPETTWAGSLEDNYAGLKWLHTNAAALGADPARIAVMGESAGGGHAALLAIAAQDRGEVPLAFQCLIYPMLDDRTGSSRPVPDHVGRIIWNAQRNRYGWESFLGMAPGGRRVPARAVPARTASLAGLPPAFIGVGSIDLFHDEDVYYAQRLNAAGVAAELIVVPGCFHGFDGIGAFDSTIRVSKWFNEAKLDALRRGLGIAA